MGMYFTLTLALSRQGRGDLLIGVHGWLRVWTILVSPEGEGMFMTGGVFSGS